MTDLSRWVHLNNTLPKMGASSNISQKGYEHTYTHLVKCDDQFVKMGASQEYVAQDG